MKTEKVMDIRKRAALRAQWRNYWAGQAMALANEVLKLQRQVEALKQEIEYLKDNLQMVKEED